MWLFPANERRNPRERNSKRISDDDGAVSRNSQKVDEKDTDEEPIEKRQRWNWKEAGLVDTLERTAKEGTSPLLIVKCILERTAKEGTSPLLIVKCIQVKNQELKRKDMIPGFQIQNNTPNPMWLKQQFEKLTSCLQ